MKELLYPLSYITVVFGSEGRVRTADNRRMKAPLFQLSYITIVFLMRACSRALQAEFGGNGEIRTHVQVAPQTVFKTATLNHSDTLPGYCSGAAHRMCALV